MGGGVGLNESECLTCWSVEHLCSAVISALC